MSRPVHPLLVRLRSATAEAHHGLERQTDSQRILDHRLTPAEYDRLIDWQAHAHRALEPLVLGYERGDYRYRSRLPHFGDARATIVPAEPDPATAIGTAYVLEGGSLGGSMIHRRLLANEHLVSRRPFTFYAAQADFGVRQWRAYVAHLDGLSLTEEEMSRVVSAAVAGFQTFGRLWSST